jgi:hypothetical protein
MSLLKDILNDVFAVPPPLLQLDLEALTRTRRLLHTMAHDVSRSSA